MRLAIVRNMIAPYTTPVFTELARRDGIELLVVYETAMESARRWTPERDLPYQHVLLDTVSVDLTRVVSQAYLHLPRSPLQQLRRFRPDAVIAGGGVWTSPTNIAAFLARSRENWAFVAGWESFARPRPTWPRRLAEPWVRYFIRSADAWLATGSRAARDLARLGADPARVAIAPYVARPAERPRIASTHESGPEMRFAYVGQLIPRKGIDVLLQAFSSTSGGRLTIAGDGPLRPAVEHAAARDARITYRGHLDWQGLADLYAGVDALVVPSRYDPFGLVVNEACERGLPVIATDQVGAVDDLVEPGVNGLVVPAESAHALAAAMDELAGWPEDRRRGAADWGTRRMRQWSLDATVKGTIRAAEMGLAHRGGRRHVVRSVAA